MSSGEPSNQWKGEQSAMGTTLWFKHRCLKTAFIPPTDELDHHHCKTGSLGESRRWATRRRRPGLAYPDVYLGTGCGTFMDLHRSRHLQCAYLDTMRNLMLRTLVAVGSEVLLSLTTRALATRELFLTQHLRKRQVVSLGTRVAFTIFDCQLAGFGASQCSQIGRLREIAQLHR